jgi:hypothetical protein
LRQQKRRGDAPAPARAGLALWPNAPQVDGFRAPSG